MLNGGLALRTSPLPVVIYVFLDMGFKLNGFE